MFFNTSWSSILRPVHTRELALAARSCSTLLPQAPGAKLRRLHQQFLAKKYVAKFCSLVSNWSKLQGQICCTSLFQEEAPSCVLKFACRAKLGSKSFVAQHTFSLEIVAADEGALLRERVAGACCHGTKNWIYSKFDLDQSRGQI